MSTKIALVLLLCSSIISCIDNGLGLTPQMGWNSWNHFACKIDQQLIKKTADKLVDLGLAKKGYVYLNLDDCWQLSRNETTKQIIEDHRTFPSGMKALSSYVHGKGLKFGLYSDAGEKTCQGRPGGLGYEAIDAKTYAAWEVDYLKYDNCYNKNQSGKLRYLAMSKALNESGRPIFYSMCNWGQEKSWEWAGPLANSWRTTGDISDNWKSFMGILDQQVGLEKYAAKGGWNDPDMLEVGNGGMTHDEYYAHFSLWCILKAPLLIGCSLDNISNDTLTILGNQELIAVNQDPLGKQGYRIKRETKGLAVVEVWGGDLTDNGFVVGFLNRGDSEVQITASILNDLKRKATSYTIRDVINHKDLGTHSDDIIKATVRKHAISVYVLKFSNNSSSAKNLVVETQ